MSVEIIGTGGTQDWSGIQSVFERVYGPIFEVVDGIITYGNPYVRIDGGALLHLPMGRCLLPVQVAAALVDSGCVVTGAPDTSLFFPEGRGVRGNWVIWPHGWPPD